MYRISIYDEVASCVAQLDKSKFLLQKTKDNASYDTYDGTESGNHPSFKEEYPSYLGFVGSHVT